MSIATMGTNISHYNQINRISGVTDADPHRLVMMLLEGALGKIAIVKGLMAREETAKKGEVIGQAIAIIGGLKSSLNIEAGGELARNLDNIYEYIEGRLLKANMKNDVSILNEVSGLLHEIKSGWESIPQDMRKQTDVDISVAS